MPRKPDGTRAKSRVETQCDICHEVCGRGYKKHRAACQRLHKLSTEISASSATSATASHAHVAEVKDVEMVDLDMQQGRGFLNDPAPRETSTYLATHDKSQALPSSEPCNDENIMQDESDRTGDFIEIEYHPSSRRATITIPFEEYNGVLKPSGDGIGGVPEEAPWSPFQTEADLFFAEKCVRQNFSNASIQEWLDLTRSLQDTDPGAPHVTFSSYRELRKTVELAASSHTGFESTIISIPFRKKALQYTVLRKPVWDWVKEILSSRPLCEQFTFDAQRKTKINSSGQRQRIYDEPWTGNKWWNLQTIIPVGSSPICLLLWCDEGVISHFGGRKSYPVVCRVLNLPSHVRNGRGIAGGRIIGWLPVISDTSDILKEDRPFWPDHRRHVWQKAVAYVVESLKIPSTFGDSFTCGDEITRHLISLIPIFSLDYKEQAIATEIRGVKGAAACPGCEEPTVNFAIALASGPPRTTAAYVQLFLKDANTTKDEYKRLGLVRMQNCFWTFPYCDIYSAMSYEVLHAFEIGIFKRFWGFLKLYMEGSAPDSASRIQQRLANLPPWSGLTTFPNVLKLGLADGSKYADLLRILLHGVHPDIRKPDTLILECIRTLGVIGVYAKLRVHTEDTLAEGRQEVKQLSRLLQKTTQNYGWIWATSPKVHALFAHLFNDIEEKGTTPTYNAKINEQMHGTLKDSTARFNNSQATLAEQLLKQNHYQVVLASMVEETKRLRDGPCPEPGPDSVQHIHLCGRGPVFAPEKPPHVEIMPFAGPVFRHILNQFMLDEYGIPSLPDNTEIRQFYELDVDYTSEEDWTTARSILHCKADYHEHPRYDSVWLHTDDGPLFARLLLLFHVAMPSKAFELACVRLFLPVTRTDWKDKAVGFRRLREIGGLKGVQIIDLQSVIRGVYTVGTGVPGEFYLNDLIDHDMFLRLRRS